MGAEETVYAVSRDGAKIGEYRFSVEECEGRRTVAVDMSITKKLLFVTLYRATHQRRDVWVGDQLVTSEGASRYNGDSYDLKFWRADGHEFLKVNGETKELSAPVMTLVPWRPAFTGAVTFLSEKGKADSVMLVYDRREAIQISGKSVEAEKYRLVGLKLREVWYGLQGTLLRIRYESRGAVIDIELEAPPGKR